MTSQADCCPIAVGVDVLGDRWTPLVIREPMVGADGFDEIHRGVPRMSRTLLAQRLRLLERQGLVTRQVGERGRPGRYTLTPVGQAVPFHDLVAKGHARLLGPSRLARSLSTWFDTAVFAEGLRRADRRRGRNTLAGGGPPQTIGAPGR
jgi:DNA-binding HxlR family transcriptional regulator